MNVTVRCVCGASGWNIHLDGVFVCQTCGGTSVEMIREDEP